MSLAPADVGYESKACLTLLGWCLSGHETPTTNKHGVV